MKIFIDPISTQDPHLCSAHFKAHTMMKYMLEKHKDVFFYYLLPKPDGSFGCDWEIDKSFLLDDPRVRYVKIPASHDRMIEYYRWRPEYEEFVSFDGSLWDWDVLCTGRTHLVPMLRNWVTRSGRAWTRMICILEEMPVMSFKPRVRKVSNEHADLLALTSYLSSDKTYMFSFHSGAEVVRVARKFYSPSNVRLIESKVQTASSRICEEPVLKSVEYVRAVADHSKKFVSGYTHRLSGNTNRREPILDLFKRQWVMHSNSKPMDFVCMTNARAAGAYQDDKEWGYVEVSRTKREDFWRRLREEIDCVFSASLDEDYPLSLIEPLLLGVPLILRESPYTHATYGKDYPFYIKGEAQLMGMLAWVYDNYEDAYDKFANWSQTTFTKLIRERNELWFAPMLERDISEFLKSRIETVTDNPGNEIMASIRKRIVKGQPFNIKELIQQAGKDGELRDFGARLDRPRGHTTMAQATDLNSYRLRLMKVDGAVDYSTKTGEMVIE